MNKPSSNFPRFFSHPSMPMGWWFREQGDTLAVIYADLVFLERVKGKIRLLVPKGWEKRHMALSSHQEYAARYLALLDTPTP